MDILVFYIAFGFCFVCFVIRTSYHVLVNRENPLDESKKLSTMILVVMPLLWFSWFCMSFNDPYEINFPSGVRYTGLAVFIIGFCLFILSHTVFKHLAGGQETDRLVTTGIYSKIRHPMYLGFIIWIIGLPIFANAAFTLVSAII